MAGQRSDRDRFIAFAFAAADLLLELDAERRIVFASGAAKSLLGLAGGPLLNLPFMNFVPPDEHSFSIRVLEALDAPGAAVRIEPCSMNLHRTDGKRLRVLVGGCRFPDVSPNYFLALSNLGIGLSSDELARDPVTQLIEPDALANAAKRLATKTGEPTTHALTMLHVEGLTDLQAAVSVERKQEMMVEIGALLRSSSTGGDTAAQLNDTDFALVQKRGADSKKLAQQIGTIAEKASGGKVPVGVRIAQVALEAAGVEDQQAAQALVYCMKKFSDSKGESFTLSTLADGFADLMSETMGRVTKMRDTVSTGGFSLVFQPIVDLKSRQIHHFEVLTRFADGQSPYEFITFSEQIGMVAEIDLAVCEKVLSLMDVHRNSSPLAVNISGRSLQSPQFMQRLARLLADRARDRAKFMFEITESSAIENLDEVNVFLQALRKAGHRVCLDDFGAGFTAYTYLRRFEVDFVKLDGPFLKSGMSNIRDRALLKSVCMVCAELGARTIGEMIETREEAYAAAGLGMTHGQGYFFGKPAPAQGLPILLAPAASSRR